jgi:hypothetical protein
VRRLPPTHEKLIRDRIPALAAAQGRSLPLRTADPSEMARSWWRARWRGGGTWGRGGGGGKGVAARCYGKPGRFGHGVSDLCLWAMFRSTLTPWLQKRFAAHCPPGWRCSSEVALVDRSGRTRLGFEPRVDVLLENESARRRVWVEFEVSRADPVANHAKFATARFFEGLPEHDSFVSMTSRHIEPGRAALAAGTAAVMRAFGIPAFQVMLFPQCDGGSIQSLNAMSPAELEREGPSVEQEVKRVLDITDARLVDNGHRIHKVDNPWTVALNVRRWNQEMALPDVAALWGRRSVQYFALDPGTHQFAPSKFCAFIPGAGLRAQAVSRLLAFDAARRGDVWAAASQSTAHVMSMDLYVLLDEGEARFDGNIARRHLEEQLGYGLVALDQAPERVKQAFGRWHENWSSHVPLRGQTHLLIPPVHAGRAIRHTRAGGSRR